MSAAPQAVAIASPTADALPLSERIGVLDVLRGLALLGMFVVHFNYYEGTPREAMTPGSMAQTVEHIIGLLFEERFYAIFGMLFGVGFAVQLSRAEARGDRFVVRYLRRLAVLAVFGFIAEGVFGYNVLFGYALWGLPLLLVRRWPTRGLIVLAVLCAASWQIYNLSRMAWYSTQPNGLEQYRAVNRARTQRFQSARAQLEEGEQAPDWRTVVAARIDFMPKFHRQWSYLPAGSFTLFLLGMIAFRLGLFQRPEEHRGLIVALMVGGAASFALAMWVFPIGGPPPATPPPGAGVRDAAITMARVSGFNLIRTQWLAFTYIGAILLLIAHNRDAWLRRFSPLAWAGRMALTNYMMQVVVVDILFTPHGFGMSVSPLMVFGSALLLFATQVVLSRWWLTRFRSGPLEWVWRSITYWKAQPLRLASRAAAPVVASA